MSYEKFFEYARRLVAQEKRNRDSWAKDLNVTIRSITNFNIRLKNEFGIFVDKKHGISSHYFIDRAKSRRYDAFINFIQNLNVSSKIAESFDSKNNFGQHLIFHQNWDKISWMRYFNELVGAINNQNLITVFYLNYRNEQVETLTNFRPYWMKQNAYYRWYILGFENDKAEFPTAFGCDKIHTLTIQKETFTRKKKQEEFREVYENVFGVYIYPERVAEIVRIECTHFQANYLKSLPLHSSQEIESESEDVTIFKYNLQINHEFAYELLRQNIWNFNTSLLHAAHPHRTAIKVLEPGWLVDYFHQTYKRSYMAYCENEKICAKIKKEIDATPQPYPIHVF